MLFMYQYRYLKLLVPEKVVLTVNYLIKKYCEKILYAILSI